ncbi:unnamed protein product [Dibothriocephalus latus]|uniref:Uncharacterized protein n=1 Tax=Dibothriocephalus latus TaxID=60516 RepID=A0A3P7NXS7_DIBLA|nr:unnamed protein product [Dibothriocephalus latus]
MESKGLTSDCDDCFLKEEAEALLARHATILVRYVDGTSDVIESDQLRTFKKRLYSVFLDIQFTMEEEENNQLTFLNVLVCCKDCGGLKT